MIVLRSTHTLKSLIFGTLIKRPLQKVEIHVDVAGMSLDQRLKWEGKLKFWRHACGCSMGAICLIGAVIFFIVSKLVARKVEFSFRAAGLFGLGLIEVALVSALLGKFLGVLLNRAVIFRIVCFRLWREVYRIENQESHR